MLFYDFSVLYTLTVRVALHFKEKQYKNVIYSFMKKYVNFP